MVRREMWIGWATACLAGAGLLGPAGADAGTARFFASAAQCEHAGVLSADACRTAFANALAEFAAKAPRFRSRRACFRDFGPCMPWPMGTHQYGEFRPQWIGVEVDDATRVTPAVAPGRQRLDFSPQSTASLSPAAAKPAAAPEAATAPEGKIMTPDDAGEDAAPPARAGGGFTMVDGVLTYPAPARFQPKVLKRP